jgi:protein TonB
MYRSDLQARDKGGAVAAVVAIHAVLLFMLLHLSGHMDLGQPQSVLRVFNVNEVPPPPPQTTPPPQTQQQQRPKETEGAASPKNVRSTATEVVAPKPEFSMPVPVPVAATRTPNVGVQPTQGASTVVGPGTGAGGSGTGTGSGGAGTGTGGGGEGGAVSPPHLVSPVLRGRDFPRTMLDQWPGAATIFLRLRVDDRGFVSECTVDRGTGIATIDSAICDLARERLRFRPALNRAGRPVAGWFGYAQPAPR